jgi:hypothetical protein
MLGRRRGEVRSLRGDEGIPCGDEPILEGEDPFVDLRGQLGDDDGRRLPDRLRRLMDRIPIAHGEVMKVGLRLVVVADHGQHDEREFAHAIGQVAVGLVARLRRLARSLQRVLVDTVILPEGGLGNPQCKVRLDQRGVGLQLGQDAVPDGDEACRREPDQMRKQN